MNLPKKQKVGEYNKTKCASLDSIWNLFGGMAWYQIENYIRLTAIPYTTSRDYILNLFGLNKNRQVSHRNLSIFLVELTRFELVTF